MSISLVSFNVRSVRASSSFVTQQSAVSITGGFEGVDSQGNWPLPYTSTRGILSVEEEIGASSSYVMQVMQQGALIYTKSSGATQAIDLATIFTLGNPCNTIGDARILFDSAAGSAGMWFAAAINQYNHNNSNCPLPGQPYADIAVSSTNNPFPSQSTWKDVRTSAYWDHPEIAVSSDKLTLTTNGPNLYVYNINDIVNQFSPNPPSAGWEDLTGQIPSVCQGQPYPVRNLSPVGRQYLVCQASGTPIPFYLFYIDGTPQSGIPNASCPQGGSNCASVSQATPFLITSISPARCCFSSSDSRTNGTPNPIVPFVSGAPYCNTTQSYCYLPVLNPVSVVWSNNLIWFAAPAGCSFPDNSLWDCIRIVQLTAYATGSASASWDQSFDLKQEGTDFYLPAISMDGMHDMSMIFTYSSPSTYPSLGVTGQGYSDQPGSYIAWRILKVGAGFDAQDVVNRFSDYFGAAVDPSDSTIVWITGTYFPQLECGSDSHPCWASWVGSVRVVGLSLSASAILVDPGSSSGTSVSIQALGGFSGAVTLSARVFNDSAGAGSILPTSLSLGVGGASSAYASVTDYDNTPIGRNYTLTMHASTQDLYLTLLIPVEVVAFDFTISVSPSSLSIHPLYDSDVSGTSTLTLTIRFGVLGPTATFTSQGQPSYMQITYNPSPANITYSPGTPVTVTFTVPAGNTIYTTQTYNVIITGTSTNISHTVTVSITVTYDCTRTGCISKPSG